MHYSTQNSFLSKNETNLPQAMIHLICLLSTDFFPQVFFLPQLNVVGLSLTPTILDTQNLIDLILHSGTCLQWFFTEKDPHTYKKL